MAETNGIQAWELTPFDGIGPFAFGMGRDEVISLLGEPEMVIARDPLLIEGYGPVKACFDVGNRLVAVELVGERPVSYRGIRLNGRHVDDVRLDLERVGIVCVRDREGMFVPSLGLDMYAHEYSHPNPFDVEAVMASGHEYGAIAAQDAELSGYDLPDNVRDLAKRFQIGEPVRWRVRELDVDNDLVNALTGLALSTTWEANELEARAAARQLEDEKAALLARPVAAMQRKWVQLAIELADNMIRQRPGRG